MNVRNIILPNQKGQIVIPVRMRKALNIAADTPLHISLKDQEIILSPVVNPEFHQDAYLEVLNKTRGKWGNIVAEKKELELSASQQRKKAW